MNRQINNSPGNLETVQVGIDERIPILVIEGLSKSYQEGEKVRVVLDQAQLEVFPGESIAVLGKSGTGKTTLLNLISGIDRADQGRINFMGRDLAALGDLELTLFRRRMIGFVFQFFNLIPTLTVWENVTLPLELNGTYKAAGIERAKSLLDEVGLLDRVKTFPDKLSGGEQQRVAIARALVHDPALVLADEPTGNLDEETGRQILDLLDRLTRQTGKNVIMVTHSQEAASYADARFALCNGKLLENRDC